MTNPRSNTRDHPVFRPAPAPPRRAPTAPTPAAPARPQDISPDTLLDDTLERLQDGAVGEALAHIVPGLRRAYGTMPRDAWDACARRCLTHPVAPLLHQDPFVYRAFAKPRGYPGDAGILDLIYQTVPVPEDTTALGAALYAYNVHAPACASVRWRRDFLADAIDEAATRAPGRARVLSVACGHLREAQCSEAVRDGAVEAFYALDQDPLSVALLAEEHVPYGVTPVLGSVKDVLTGRVSYGGLTLAYAAGLYDYLPAPVAARLTRRMFDMLAPGGRLIVANFCPELRDIGFMEAFMDWRLIYRDEAGMREVAAAVPGGEVAAQRTFRDLGGDVVYLEIVRG